MSRLDARPRSRSRPAYFSNKAAPRTWSGLARHHRRSQCGLLVSLFSCSSSPRHCFSTQNSAIRSFFSDDNSTFFPARPAAFGPPLPAKGLSGQLWIGSGFTDDNLQDGAVEGELGCTDVPGWEERKLNLATNMAEKPFVKDKAQDMRNKERSKRDVVMANPPVGRISSIEMPQQGDSSLADGTDDHLHQGLRPSSQAEHDGSLSASPSHADIQSIQEAAEIAGKVVLLSRGGCGFLEKVKWAQRRGAIALIVGDNQKGGPLIQMYARGNVDNVTIHSAFTSRTTAHLLSSLMQPGSFIEDMLDERGRPALKVQQSDKMSKQSIAKVPAPKSPALGAVRNTKSASKASAKAGERSQRRQSTQTRRSWPSRLFHWGGGDSTASDRSRPPSSGQLDWVLVDEWSDEKDKLMRHNIDKNSKSGPDQSTNLHSQKGSGDNFQIGVQDWRDPDLVAAEVQGKVASKHKENGRLPAAVELGATGRVSSKPQNLQSSVKDANGPKGGSITPGSGDYSVVSDSKADTSSTTRTKQSSAGSQGSLMTKLFGDGEAGSRARGASHPPIQDARPVSTPKKKADNGIRQGLWVTITPTSSANPIFDTLLVLVVSPLITLTVVYAILLLRANIRRRRWRAPKSVVERLPVRTYHTVAASPAHSPRLPSPTTASPTTPLLQGSSRSRPRSRTTTGVPDSSHLRAASALREPPSLSGEKSSPDSSSEWRKYMGRQVECVVCLEEYVDGVSRVMSLPCGHEFHAECITPWLTTRRRTCPICKGDVVRYLARGTTSSSRYEPYRDDSGDEAEASRPVRSRSPSPRRDSDMEQGGILSPSPRHCHRSRRSEGWLTKLTSRLGAGSSSRHRRDSSEDRTR